MRKITFALLALILVGMLIPAGFSADSNLVITYGETTHGNSNYKSIVDSFFSSQAGIDINNAESKIITADQVNQISGGITGKTSRWIRSWASSSRSCWVSILGVAL